MSRVSRPRSTRDTQWIDQGAQSDGNGASQRSNARLDSNSRLLAEVVALQDDGVGNYDYLTDYQTAALHCQRCLSPRCHDTHPLRPSNPTVSVVIPAKNEATNLAWVLGRLPDCVDEVILVDGHSMDATIAVAQTLVPTIRVIKQPNDGKGNAIAIGLLAARSDIAVMIDADGSMDPTEIPHLVSALTCGADVVKASRNISGGGSGDLSLIRRIGTFGMILLTDLLYRQRWTELTYGLAAFWTDALGTLCLAELAASRPARKPGRFWKGPWYGHGFEIETILFCRAAGANLRIAEVFSYEYKRRSGRSNLLTWKDGCRVLLAIFRELHRHSRHQASSECREWGARA